MEHELGEQQEQMESLRKAQSKSNADEGGLSEAAKVEQGCAAGEKSKPMNVISVGTGGGTVAKTIYGG